MEGTYSPTKFWIDATLSDTVNEARGECNYLYVGVTGNITCICNGAAQLFSNLAVGYHPIKTTRINVTGSTAGMLIKLAY